MTVGVLIDIAIAGGLQIAAIEEVRSLLKLGHNANLVILSKSGISEEFLKLTKKIPVNYLQNFSIIIPGFNFLSTAHFTAPLIAPFTLHGYDLLISHNTTTTFTALAMHFTRKTPFITIIHDPLPYTLNRIYPKIFSLLTPSVCFLERISINHALKVSIDSPLHANLIKDLYHVTPQIIPLGVTPPSKPLAKLGNKILSTSRWQKEKHPERLLYLLSKFPRANLVIAGSWSKDLDWFKQEIAKRHLTSQVKVVTNFPQHNRRKLFKQARVWIHPNLEAFGLDGILAAAYGLPVIMPSKSGAASLLPNIQPISSLKKLLTNRRFATSIGKKNYLTVKNHYTWHIHTQKLLL